MKKILFSTVAIIAGITAASAADLPRRQAAPAYAPVSYAFSWTGFYVGGQVGYGFGEVDGTLTNAAGLLPAPYSYDVDGFVGGIHAGFNYQWNSVVAGLEADAEYSAQNGARSGFGAGPFYHNTDINWQGSLRARLGIAFDRALIYATGGLAIADIDHQIGNVGAVPFHTWGDTRMGWTAGVGLEYAFTNNWTARAEYRYTNFQNASDLNVPANSADRSDLTTQTIRLGVSYKF